MVNRTEERSPTRSVVKPSPSDLDSPVLREELVRLNAERTDLLASPAGDAQNDPYILHPMADEPSLTKAKLEEIVAKEPSLTKAKLEEIVRKLKVGLHRAKLTKDGCARLNMDWYDATMTEIATVLAGPGQNENATTTAVGTLSGA